jgi:hypothetical protein
MADSRKQEAGREGEGEGEGEREREGEREKRKKKDYGLYTPSVKSYANI